MSNTNKEYSAAVSRVIAARASRTAPLARSDILLHQHFSVVQEHKELQLPAWRDYLDRFLDVSVKRSQLEQGFHGEVDTYLLPDMVYLDSRTAAFTQARSNARISTDNVRDFVFHIAVEGIIETTTNTPRARSSQYQPGILALDLGQPMTMMRPTAARVLAFFLPRAMVYAAVPDAEAIHGRVISYTTPLTRLILERVRALCQAMPVLPVEQQQQAIHTCAELILAAFARQQRMNGQGRAAVRAALQGRIEEYIQANLHREDLSPDTVMHAFPVARATIYRMFEPQGGLHAYIRHCRLREAAHELVTLPQLAVADIGLGLGFNSASDFSRAFSRQYSISPRDYREQSL